MCRLSFSKTTLLLLSVLFIQLRYTSKTNPNLILLALPILLQAHFAFNCFINIVTVLPQLTLFYFCYFCGFNYVF